MAKPPGGFTNPFEYREMMKAAVGYSDETVDQVLARHKARSTARGTPAKKGAPPPSSVPRKSELDKLAALKAGGKPRPAPPVG